MTVDQETVKKVAHLARIAVTDEELPGLQNELNGLLAFVEQLNKFDITGVDAMLAGLPVKVPTKMRADVVTAGSDAAAVMQNAPAQEDHFFLVPKVVE